MQRLRTVTSLDVRAVAGHHAMPAALLLMDLFETLHTCCGHIEDVHVVFGGARINFD